jgi:REP element-mobilizing transposase RayT
MIIEDIPTKKKDARGTVASTIEYFFDVTDADKNKSKETVKFIGTSRSLCIPDPQHSFLSNKGEEVDLSLLIEAFEEIETKNNRVKKPYRHIVFSLREKEELTTTEWHDLLSEYFDKMGYADHHWFGVNHSNTINNHAHVLLSCIPNLPPYKKQNDSFNFKKSGPIRDELEKKYGLQHDNNPFSDDVCQKVNNSQYKPHMQAVRDTIDLVLQQVSDERLSLIGFIECLNKKGVGCHVQFSNQEVRGMSYTLGSYKFKASKLGKGYRFNDIQDKGVFYDEKLHYIDIELSNDDELMVTDLIENGFQSAPYSQEEKNYHYVLIPNQETKQFPLESKLHSFQLYNLWFPVNTQGKTRQQIESDLMQMKMIRMLLTLYFRWLYDSERHDKRQTGLKLNNQKVGISTGLKLTAEQLKTIVKQPANFKILKQHDSLLISKQEFLKLQGINKKLVSNPPSSMAMSIF